MDLDSPNIRVMVVTHRDGRDGLLFLLTLSIAIASVFVCSYFNASVYSKDCPENCVQMPCILHTVYHSSGNSKLCMSTGPCQCIKENSFGPPTAVCTSFKYLESPTFRDRWQTQHLPSYLIPVILCMVGALTALSNLGFCQFGFAALSNVLPKNDDEKSKVSKG